MPIDYYTITTDTGDKVTIPDPFISSPAQVDPTIGAPVKTSTDGMFKISKINPPKGYEDVENKLYNQAMAIMQQPRGPREQQHYAEQKQHYLEMLSKAPSWSQVLEMGFHSSIAGEVFGSQNKLEPYTQQWDISHTAIKDIAGFASDAWLFFLLSMGVGEVAGTVGLVSKVGKFAAGAIQSGAVLGSYGGIRQIVTDAVLHNWTRSPSDFLSSAGRALSRTAHDTLTGLAIGGVSGIFGKLAQPFIDKSAEDIAAMASGGEARSFAAQLKTAAAARFIKETGIAAEGLVFGSMTPLLNGRLPSKESIIQGIVDMYGIRAVNSGTGYAFDAFKDFREAYVRHGVTPRDIIKQAEYDISILQDAANETTVGFRSFSPLHQMGETGTRTIEIPESADPVTKRVLQRAKDEQDANRRLKMIYDARKELHDKRVSLSEDAKPSETGKQVEANATTSEAEFVDVPTPDQIVDSINRYVEAGDIQKATDYASTLVNEQLLTMPDLVNIVYELTRGNFPQIKKIINDDPGTKGLFKFGWKDAKGNNVFAKSPRDLKVFIKQDLFKQPAVALRVLAHEIGHLISWFPNNILTEYRTDTLRLLTGMRDIHDLFHQLIKSGKFTDQDVSVTYAEIDQELTNASGVWRPWPKEQYEKMIAEGTATKDIRDYYNYRMAAAEKIADSIAVILNQPKLAERLMPQSIKLFHKFLDSKPEVKRMYDSMMDSIHAGANLEHAENRVKEDFADGEARMIHKEEMDQIRNQVVENIKKAQNAAIYDNKFAALLNPKFGYNLKDEIINKIQKFYHYDSISQNYMDQMERHVLKKMRKYGYSAEDVGLALFYNRISAGDRQKFANARGFTVAEADARMKVLTSDKPFMKDVINGFYKVRNEFVLPMILNSDIVPDRLKTAVRRNPAYAKFFVTEFIDGEWGKGAAASMFGGSSSIAFADLQSVEKAQKGFLGKIANPLFMTMVNDVALTRAIMRQETINKVLDAVREQAPDDVLTNEEYNDEKLIEKRAERGKLNKEDYEEVTYIAKVAKTATNPETGKLETVYKTDENGNEVPETELQKITYHVLTPIMDGFKNESPKMATWLAGLAGGKVQKSLDVSNKLFRLLVITTNTGFILRNAFYRDNMRTVLNMPGLGPLRAYKLLPYVMSTYQDVYKYMAHGELSSDVHDAIYEGLWSTTQNYEGRDSISTNPTETMLRRYGKNMVTQEAYVDRNVYTMSQRFDDATEKLDVVNDFFEKANKLLAYKFLKANQDRLRMTDDEVEMAVRMAAASPDFMAKGTGSHVFNSVIPFANAVHKAYTGNFYAARKLGYSAYAFRVGTSAILLGLISAMAEKHLFDWDFWSENAKPGEVIAGVTKYKRDHYFIIPKNINSDGKSVALVIPLPDRVDFRIPYILTRSLTKLFIDKAKGGDVESANWLNEIYRNALQPTLGFSENELLGFSPLIRTTANLSQFAVSNNYFDGYKARMKYTDKEVRQFQNHPGTAYRRFFADQLQVFGFQRDFMRWVGGDMKTPQQEGNALSKFINMTTDGILGSFIYVGDWGIRQDLQDKAAKRALLKQEAADTINQEVSGETVSSRQKQFAEQYGSRAMVLTAQKKEQVTNAVRETPKRFQHWANWYLHADKQGKLDVLQRAQENPNGRDWLKYMQQEYGINAQ